ncbi:uncharacterized protein LOC122243210 isoform X2 [Penaeus japonicus]|nr:uncharacterized protein LOC122243210 isoform X2 [Penaeus japonicus]XP_042856638.1 uncharacterized protein LOC122243210 isoform X2 [Penaeus japonicus]
MVSENLLSMGNYAKEEATTSSEGLAEYVPKVVGHDPRSSGVGTGSLSPSRSQKPSSYMLYASPLNLYYKTSTHQHHSPLRRTYHAKFSSHTLYQDRNPFTKHPSVSAYPLTIYKGRPSSSMEAISTPSSDSTALFNGATSDKALDASPTDILQPTDSYEYPSSLSSSSSSDLVDRSSADLRRSGNISSNVKVIGQSSKTNKRRLEDNQPNLRLVLDPKLRQRSVLLRNVENESTISPLDSRQEVTKKSILSIPQDPAFDIKFKDHVTINMSTDLMGVKLDTDTSGNMKARDSEFIRLFSEKNPGKKKDLKSQTPVKLLRKRDVGNLLEKNVQNDNKQKESNSFFSAFPISINNAILQRTGAKQENLRSKRSGDAAGDRWVWSTPTQSTTAAPQMTTAFPFDTQMAETYTHLGDIPEQHFPSSHGGYHTFVQHPQFVPASPNEEYNSSEENLQDTHETFVEPNYNPNPAKLDSIDRDYTHGYPPASSYSYTQPSDNSYHRKEKPHHPIETKISLTFPINKTLSFRWYKALTMNASFSDIHNPFKPFLQFGFSSGMEPVHHPHSGYETHHGHHTPSYRRQIDVPSSHIPSDQYDSGDLEDTSFNFFNLLPKIGLSFARGKESIASAFDPLGSIKGAWNSFKDFFGVSDETNEELNETSDIPKYVSLPTEHHRQPSETYMQSNVYGPSVGTYGPLTAKPSLHFYEASADDKSSIHIGRYNPPAIYLPVEEMYASSSASHFKTKEADTPTTQPNAVSWDSPSPSSEMNTPTTNLRMQSPNPEHQTSDFVSDDRMTHGGSFWPRRQSGARHRSPKLGRSHSISVKDTEGNKDPFLVVKAPVFSQ